MNLKGITKLISSRIIQGKVTKCDYDSSGGRLVIKGWAYPSSGYNRVVVRQGDKKIGNAVIGCKSHFVKENFPDENEEYSGFVLMDENIMLNPDKQIHIELFKDNQCKRRFAISVNSKEIDYCKILTFRDYIIRTDLNKCNDKQIARIKKYNDCIISLIKWLDFTHLTFYKRFENAKDKILHTDDDIGIVIIDIFSDGNIMHLKKGDIEFQQKNRFWVIINELLINEEYYHVSKVQRPYMIDAGANIGLAIFYLKSLYPNAEIDAFEPAEETFAVLERNKERNGWANVTIHNCALDDEEKATEIIIPTDDYLGASLTSRASENRDVNTIIKKPITTKKLSPFLSRDVDFLKMDIEGVESRVLREAGNKLSCVDNLFIEYHFSKQIDNNLVELLSILEQNDFQYQISKSTGYHQATIYKTMRYVGRKYSLNIWAKKSTTRG